MTFIEFQISQQYERGEQRYLLADIILGGAGKRHCGMRLSPKECWDVPDFVLLEWNKRMSRKDHCTARNGVFEISHVHSCTFLKKG